jgi:hypothetical protein
LYEIGKLREQFEARFYKGALFSFESKRLTMCSADSAGVYLMSDTSGLSHGPYLGTTTFCSLASLLILLIKASVYSPGQDIGPELSPSLPDQKLNLKKLWGMPVLFLSSLVFALGHVIVAYRTSCRARRKLLIHRIDPESVRLSCTYSYKSRFMNCTN